MIDANTDGPTLAVSGKRVMCSAHRGDGHSIPVLSLASKLSSLNDVVMISRSEHSSRLAASKGIHYIPQLFETNANYDPFSELALLESVNPDISIVDYDLVMWILFQAHKPPCTISILRSELLLHYQRRNMFLPDKFGFFDGSATRRYNAILSSHNCAPLQDARELFLGDVVVLPTIPDLEPLPDGTKSCYPHIDFVYTGPLIMPTAVTIAESLQDWLGTARRSGAPIAMITLGTVWGEQLYVELINSFSGSEFSVLAVVPQKHIRDKLSPRSNSMFHVTGFGDLRVLAKYVDVIVHHCGHGTLQTAILAGKPSLTLPSGEYDREDNALRMQDLGCGRHLGHDFFRKGLRTAKLANAASKLIRRTETQRQLTNLSSIMIDYANGKGFKDLTRVIVSRL